MRKLVLGVSFALAATSSVTLGLVQRVNAQAFDIASPQLIAQSAELDGGATLEPITEAANFYGFVDSFDGQNLTVRLPGGQVESFTLPEGIGGVDASLDPGSLVAVNADKDNIISGLDSPVVDTEFIGTLDSVNEVDDSQVELLATSETGEPMTVEIARSTVDRLGIAPGDEIKVTKFQNIPDLSAVCKVSR